LIGRTLSHYRIVAAIGAGGMGQVYRATDTTLGRDVALKLLPAEMATNPESLARFQREARVVAALNNPHIVTIFSVEQDDGVHFLTMELVQGRSLDKLISGGIAESQSHPNCFIHRGRFGCRTREGDRPSRPEAR
jgi:eukaryotic-like serine/threonine-protein kinase